MPERPLQVQETPLSPDPSWNCVALDAALYWPIGSDHPLQEARPSGGASVPGGPRA